MKRHYSIVIPSVLKELVKVEQFAEQVARKTGLSNCDRDDVAIAVTEAVNNAIIHGNKSDKDKKVYIDFVANDEEVVITIRDEGCGFDPRILIDPTTQENIMKESGRGIFVLKSLMDTVNFSFTPCTVVTMGKKITRK
jgi:serine/threonine-protein kinase RsbW